jgi:hypothetical protein
VFPEKSIDPEEIILGKGLKRIDISSAIDTEKFPAGEIIYFIHFEDKKMWAKLKKGSCEPCVGEIPLRNFTSSKSDNDKLIDYFARQWGIRVEQLRNIVVSEAPVKKI